MIFSFSVNSVIPSIQVNMVIQKISAYPSKQNALMIKLKINKIGFILFDIDSNE